MGIQIGNFAHIPTVAEKSIIKEKGFVVESIYKSSKPIIKTPVPYRPPNLKASPKPKTESKTVVVGDPGPVRRVIDAIVPGAGLLPGGTAGMITETIVKNPGIVIGSVLPIVPTLTFPFVGPEALPGYLASKGQQEIVLQKIKENPDIPQEIKNDIERNHLEMYDEFEQNVKDLPGDVIHNISVAIPDIKFPEIKFPEFPKLPDFSGVGKWLLIGGAVLVGVLVLPALLSSFLSRKALKQM